MGIISIDYRSRKPIYEQLTENIRELVIKGIIKQDEFLPSVRSLASELGINPNTIQKAYSELERQNIICTVQGRGSMICSDMTLLIEEQRAVVISEVIECLKRADELGVSKKTIHETVDSVMKGETDE
jgi:Predicted transcriptional regulators